ncbi:hypothetical protein KEM54_004645 [Ascosphaera aggregata]|nr:hypothetical protein KEM54_004645 [Ascosphaera aggregata]
MARPEITNLRGLQLSKTVEAIPYYRLDVPVPDIRSQVSNWYTSEVTSPDATTRLIGYRNVLLPEAIAANWPRVSRAAHSELDVMSSGAENVNRLAAYSTFHIALRLNKSLASLLGHCDNTIWIMRAVAQFGAPTLRSENADARLLSQHIMRDSDLVPHLIYLSLVFGAKVYRKREWSVEGKGAHALL